MTGEPSPTPSPAPLPPTGQGQEILRDCLRSERATVELIKNKDPQSMRILEAFQRFEEK